MRHPADELDWPAPAVGGSELIRGLNVAGNLYTEQAMRAERRKAWDAAMALQNKNAERYLWLRDVGDAAWRPFALREGYSARQADMNIDAAIAAEAAARAALAGAQKKDNA